MTYRFFILLVLWPGLVVLQGQQSESRTSPPRASNLASAIRAVRENGEDTLELPHVLSTPVKVNSLADAAKRYAFIVAFPTDHVVVADEDAMFLTTWFKFRATNVLFYGGPRSQISRRRNTTYERLPNDLVPLGPMDFLLPTLGGQRLIDGVQVKSTSNARNRFDEQDSYLMIVDFDDETGKIASLPYGSYGLFRLDGDNLRPTVEESGSPLAVEIRQKFNRSFKALETAVRRYRSGEL